MDNVVNAVAKLVSYLWVSFLDELAEKRVSDWDRAVTCQVCGASIVHVYTVQKADGSTIVVGRECAHRAMGWTAPKPAVLRRVELESLAAEARRAKLLEVAVRNALPTRAEAARACRVRNGGGDFALKVLEVAPGSFYAVPAGHAAELEVALSG